nr:SDR family NAD(P)-dependent oxidoreductase [Dehalococcoidia bacterium]
MGGIQLDGKVALVTGASRGIGAVVAHRLAQAGARVGVNFHASSDAAEIVVDSINKAGGKAILVGGDVSLEEPAEKVIKDLVDHYGRIDILVNNAGINKDQLLIRMKPE